MTFSRRCLRHLLHSGMTYFIHSWSKRGFGSFRHIAGNPTNRSATGKDIKGHFEITSIHCCKRAVFWRLGLGFPGIRLGCRVSGLSGGTCGQVPPSESAGMKRTSSLRLLADVRPGYLTPAFSPALNFMLVSVGKKSGTGG